MAVPKQNLNLPFMGLDLKSDPFKILPGRFLKLANVIFQKGGPLGFLLQKRNGNLQLPSLPDTTSKYVSTFNGNLTAIGTNILAFSQGSQSWINRGTLKPIALNVLPLIRNSNNQTWADSAVSSNGLVCTVYIDTPPSGTLYRYVVADSTTGQNVIAPTSFTATGSPRVFVFNNYFMIVLPNGANIQYIAISINSLTVSAAVTIASTLSFSSTNNFDGVVANGYLYVTWNATDGGGGVRLTSISGNLSIATPVVFTGTSANIITICADLTEVSSTIWVAWYKTVGTTGFVFAVDPQLNTILGKTQIISAGSCVNLASAAQNGVLNVYLEQATTYAFDATIANHTLKKLTVTEAGTVAILNGTTFAHGQGLASKAFIQKSTIYFLVAYQSTNQSSYFLVDSSDTIIAKLSYTNGNGYLTLGLPGVSLNGTLASIAYILKDTITPVNKGTNIASGTQIVGIYAQTGINLVDFNFTATLSTAEIGNDLHLSGGFLWMYDGFQPVEHNFHLFPDLDLNADNTYHGLTSATAGGHLTDSTKYFYQVTYEWSDNQGNLFRSAPSVPVSITTGASGSNVNTNTLKVPTLRLTAKTTNVVKIVAYRWTAAQPIYYQVTSITVPTLNDVTAEIVTITDTLSDASILGNSILYTTGGVVEDTGAPATNAITLYKSRLFLIDAEDPNLLWFSKQVIEATPVEMSDLFTLFIASTIGSQGSTGPLESLAAMDDKLILFKANAIYYITGTGPDNTGSNNDFSEPVFITSTIGCSNQNSIVFIPNGLMFQSDKGIWLLGRDLSTSYIGAPVEDFNSSTVLSAVAVPGTNQVRFTLNNGVTLMYDYYFQQWGTFTGVPAISSTLYQNKHSFIDSYGRVFQENPGSFLDGTLPVLMNFQTGWFNLMGLQGYERAYYFQFLGTYLSPHILSFQMAFDYKTPTQFANLTPDNFNPKYGGDPFYGSGSLYGGVSPVEQGRIFFKTQKCESFQITMQEVYDPSLGVQADEGLTLSGINLIVGAKKSYLPIKAAASAG